MTTRDYSPVAAEHEQAGPPSGGPGLGNRRAAMQHLLSTASYEVLPFKGTEDAVLAHVPRHVSLTVTTTEAKGLEPTVDLAVRLASAGYAPAPHLAARLVRDHGHLADLLARLHEAGIASAFVIGGDAKEPEGPYPDAGSLLEAIAETGYRFDHLGIGGYPEGHAHIDEAALRGALQRKAAHATQLITQLCFDATTTVSWAREVAASGVDLAVRVGLPGAVNREKLVRISAGIGLGQSARFLTKQRGMLWRFFVPGGYRPDRLVDRLSRTVGQPGNPINGLHFFTFNDVAGTERWRQRMLARVS